MHGLGGYNNRGCRCAVCREAHREYHRKYGPAYKRRWRRMVREAAKPLVSDHVAVTPSPTSDEGKRFVVRSVTGCAIDPTKGSSRGMAFATSYTVLDRLDCWRIVYEPPRHADGRANSRGGLLAEQTAKRLNAEHEARLAA